MFYFNAALNVAKVAVGVGFVIFIHELGHFLLAKWNGVKVETFSIGFGPTLASYRPGAGFRIGSGIPAPSEADASQVGETEYVLAALPLGGYVKMLGEGVVEGIGEKNPDPRAYQNKPVFGRMGIISAGVIMNLIMGVACFAYVFGQGTFEEPAVIGKVLAGDPAYEAGLRVDDEIVALDGQRGVSFGQLARRINLSGAGQKVRLDVRRVGVADEITYVIEPKRGPERDFPTIGIGQAESLDLLARRPYVAPAGQPAPKPTPFAGVGPKDELRVVAIGPEGGDLATVTDHATLARQLDDLRDRPIVVEAEWVKVAEDKTKSEPERIRATLPPHPFLDFGLRMTAGPIESVQRGSIAAKAGLKAGDRIVAVDGDPEFDPMHLPDLARAKAGQPLSLTLERTLGAAKGPNTPVEVTVVPDNSPVWSVPMGESEPLDIPGLGLAIRVEAKVRAVAEGSPAAKAGIKPGDAIRAFVVTPEENDGAPGKTRTVEIDAAHPAWASTFVAIQDGQWSAVKLLFGDRKDPVAIQPEAAPGWYLPDRGLQLMSLVRPIPPQGLVASLRMGLQETYDDVLSIYGTVRGLAQRRVGTKSMGGLPRIAQMAYQSASSGITPFIQFLGMLSVNLAVLNFLPIPPLDGGQMVFLVAEKVRGRPLPEAALNVGTFAGIIFVLSLILFINFQDVYLIAKDYFS